MHTQRGYNKNNCIAIAAGFKHFGSDDFIFGTYNDHEHVGVNLADRIYIMATSWIDSASGTSGTRPYKVVLMKIA